MFIKNKSLKRYLFMSIISFVYTVSVSAQDKSFFLAEKEKGYLAINLLGIASPIGNFSNNSDEYRQIGNQNGLGCAKLGYSATINYMGYFHKYLGVGAILGYSVQALDADVYNKAYYIPVNATNLDSKSNSYQIPYTGATLGFRFPIENFSIQAKGIVALSWLNSPQTNFSYRYYSYTTNYYGYYGNYYNSVTYTEKSSFVFTPMLGVAFGVRYQFGIAGLNLEATYLATPEINFPMTGTYSGSGYQSYNYTKTIAITNLCVSFGVSFGLY